MRIKKIPHRKGNIMKWMEVIKINVANNRRAAVESQIETIRRGLNEKPDRKSGQVLKTEQLKLYRNLLDNNLSIHLRWNKGTAEPRGSESVSIRKFEFPDENELGQCLIHLMKEAGLVSHGVWVEEKK